MVCSAEYGSGDCPSAESAAEFVPKTKSLSVLREAARHCRGCDLYCNATQTVFGEGPLRAVLMFVGEQPGDQEDREGKPFVGPSGKMLAACLEEAGIERDKCYVTNAVKHFKWEPRGKRRIHAKPGVKEIRACAPWLEAEISLVKPRVIVPLGSTAIRAVLGPEAKVTRDRGHFFTDRPSAPFIMPTVHPSSLLRAPDAAGREEARREFMADLRVLARKLKSISRPA